MGGKMMSTVALFDLTKQNVATADPLNPGFNLAIGEVRSRGAEFDIQGEPTCRATWLAYGIRIHSNKIHF